MLATPLLGDKHNGRTQAQCRVSGFNGAQASISEAASTAKLSARLSMTASFRVLV